MFGDERLEKLDRVYGIFNIFQIVGLVVGTLAAGLAGLLSNELCGTLYVVILFGEVIAFILFGIITMNMTDNTMMKRYPDVKPKRSISIGPGRTQYSEDLNGPMIKKVRKTHDQLAASVYQKLGRTWKLAILNILLPVVAIYFMARFRQQ